jgi:phosphoglycolate phosphatase
MSLVPTPHDVRAAVGTPCTAVGPRRFDLVSFDLDGTLVDTASEIVEAAQRSLRSLGLPDLPPQDIVNLIGHGTRELMQGVMLRAKRPPGPLRDPQPLDEVMRCFDQHYAATSGTMARPYDGAAAMLDTLRAAGVHVACVTNKEQRHALRVLEATGLASRMALVIGGDSLPHKKPHASVLQHVMQHFGVAADRTLHVGDSGIDVTAARQAGVAAWAVPWGYNSGQPIAAHRPDRILAHWDDLVPWVGVGARDEGSSA